MLECCGTLVVDDLLVDESAAFEVHAIQAWSQPQVEAAFGLTANYMRCIIDGDLDGWIRSHMERGRFDVGLFIVFIVFIM